MLEVKTFLFIFFYFYYTDHLPCLIWACHGDITFIQGRVGGTLEGQKEMMNREKAEGRKTPGDILSLLELNSLYYSLFLGHLS